MNILLKNINIICGHYGCGKTNFSINLALNEAKQGNVTLVDLDIVNPYFRSGDYKKLLEDNGVHVIAPKFLGTNLDNPSLPAEIYSIFDNDDSTVIIDLGGDDAGAFALGRVSKQILESDYAMFYVVNCFRALTQTSAQAVEILSEIEKASRLKANGIINNSHLQNLTTENEIEKGYKYAKETALKLDLPLVATTCPKEIANKVNNIDNLYPIDVIVKPPFDN